MKSNSHKGPETDENASELAALENAIETVRDAQNEASGSNVYWDSREYRYFDPSDNYKGEPDEDVRKYVRQDYERMESLNRGHWGYMGIKAEAKILVGNTAQEISSGGLWGIESDSDEGHIQSTEQEELRELREQLKALGFGTRAIAQAFKNVQHEGI